MKKGQKIGAIYNDALLILSETDPTLAQELLNEAGIDANKIVTKSLKHISSYEFQLAKHIGASQRESLRAQVTEKIERLYQTVPDLVSELIGRFSPNTKLALRFQGKGNTDGDWLENIDLAGLLIELNKLEADIK